jgi:hypothetical protein
VQRLEFRRGGGRVECEVFVLQVWWVPDMGCCVQVFSFPVASPRGALVRDDVDAVSHLQLCLDYQRHWCEHKPSVTVSVRDGEWGTVGEWVYEHFDELAGAAFLPFDTGTYQQTPYEAIDEARYRQLAAAMPASIDWCGFQAVERGFRDFKVGGDLACSTGECEVVGEPVGVPGEPSRDGQPAERRAIASAGR